MGKDSFLGAAFPLQISKRECFPDHFLILTGQYDLLGNNKVQPVYSVQLTLACLGQLKRHSREI